MTSCFTDHNIKEMSGIHRFARRISKVEFQAVALSPSGTALRRWGDSEGEYPGIAPDDGAVRIEPFGPR